MASSLRVATSSPKKMGRAQHVGPTHKCVTGLKIYIFSADKTKIHFFMFLNRQSQFILCGEKKRKFFHGISSGNY